MSSRFNSFCLTYFIAAIFISSCSILPRESENLDERSMQFGEDVFAGLEVAMDSSSYEIALDKARTLINGIPGFHRMDEVYYYAASASFELARYDEAIKYASIIPDKYPVSPHLEEALFLSAESFFRLEWYYDCVDALTRILISPVEPELEKKALQLQKVAREKLSPGDIENLLKKYPSAPLAEDVSLDIAKKEFARGNHAQAYDLLANLIFKYPQHKRATEIRRLLKIASTRRTAPSSKTILVDPFKIGAILPITGRSSLPGRYFEKGLTQALEEFNSNNEFSVSLVKTDSKGNPFGAIKAARKLIHEEGVLAIVGPILLMPTIAAAIEANAWGVPLLSPVVTNDKLSEIGPWIFQTKIPGEVEVTAVTGMAVQHLLLQRYAVLAPIEGEKRRLADFFLQEIRRLGCEIVAAEYFEPGATDFKDQLEMIREAAPEALFIPARPQELILILPQIRFYDLQVQLLGLSDWYSEKLVRISRQEIEGALFPLEAYHGEDAAVFEHFLEAHRGQGDEEPDLLTVAGYFGMRALLRCIARGLSDREQARDFLFEELYSDAAQRMGEAEAITILIVRAGKITEFTPVSTEGQ